MGVRFGEKEEEKTGEREEERELHDNTGTALKSRRQTLVYF